MMKFYLGIMMILGCLSLPADADLADIEPIVQYTLPADIMQVAFANETWIYRLHEDGTVRKVVRARVATTQDTKLQKKEYLVELGSMLKTANPFCWACNGDDNRPPSPNSNNV